MDLAGIKVILLYTQILNQLPVQIVRDHESL